MVEGTKIIQDMKMEIEEIKNRNWGFSGNERFRNANRNCRGKLY